LEKRDDCEKQYKESGAEPVIAQTNTKGAAYMARNPALKTWMDLNAQALAYWRDLGLTPAGFKKLSDQKINTKPKKSGLELALEKLSAAQ
jgi:phage terminase small subunit